MTRRHTQPASIAPGYLLLGSIFLLSGTTALIYEAAWQRQFTLLFGSAAPATAVVLAAYFAGLGLGSVVMGKAGARWERPLFVYGVLEVVTAAGALLVAPVLSLYAAFNPAVIQGGGAWFLAVKAALAFAAIVLPTMAMGGTLPVLARLAEGRRSQLGDFAGWLYMLNTTGAAAGVLAFPLLLNVMGMRNTVWLCAGLNVTIAAAAFLLAKANIPGFSQPPPRVVAPSGFRAHRWMCLAFVSGFVTFVLQVGWSRAFGQVHGNSIYSFSLIVALFIAAIATGAQLARILLRGKRLPQSALGGVWLAGGFLTLVAPVVFAGMSDGLKFAPDAAGGSVFGWHLVRPALVVIFVPVLFLAAGLPLILQGAANASKRPAGELTGAVFAWNIAGSVAGALAAGFLFPYSLGLWRTIIAAGAMVLIIASVLAGGTPLKRIALLCVSILCSGFVMMKEWPRIRIETADREKLVSVREGAYGIAAVVERPGSRRLKLNNHYTLGGTSSVGDERMQAHVPLLLHPNPQRVSFLGYGTGISAGGALFHAPEQVTAVELVPEVASLASSYFANENNHFAANSSTRIVSDDARNWLRGTTEHFHVIVGDLVVPWKPGEGALYTLEHFEAARARLMRGGLYCAWLPMFQLGRDDFECILSTFLHVFPQAYLWRGDFSPSEPALAIVGFPEDGWQPETPSRRMEQMQPDPANPQLKYPRALWMHFIGIARAGSSGLLNTEDRPRVELRMTKAQPFAGRELQQWTNQIRSDSMPALRESLPPDALAGWEAGALMSEFTLLFVEGKEAAANAVAQQLRDKLGDEVARHIFGN